MKQLFGSTLSRVLIISIAVLTFSLGVGYYQNAAAASSQTHDKASFFAADASASRWQAIADYYAPNLDITDASASRWQAIADYNAPNLDIADASASRWQAIADYYASNFLYSR